MCAVVEFSSLLEVLDFLGASAPSFCEILPVSHHMLTADAAAAQEYYGKVLQSSKDLKTSACTAAGRPHPLLRSLMARLPEDVLSKFYGCGAPVPLGITGLRVLDLGSGSGRDCYLAAALVGEAGSVTGIDMTEEQLKVSGHALADVPARHCMLHPLVPKH